MPHPDECSDRQLIEGIGNLHATASAVQRSLLRFIREYDRRELWQRDGCRHMGHWLAGHLGISVSAGLRWTEAAHALEHLPLVSSALEEGVLSLDKVLQLARFATAETEKELVRWARRTSVNAIRRKADLANRPSLEDTRVAHEDRYLQWWSCDDGRRVALEAMLPSDQGALVTKALRRVADQLPVMPGEENGLEQRLADALVALSSTQIARDQDPDRATVVVHADLEALAGNDHGCEIDGGHVIHPEVARRMSCDCRLQFVLHNKEGKAVGIGRVSRDVPDWLRRELLHRDGGCTFPGCGTRAFVAGHHIIHWPDGPTELDNLVLACSFHHKLVHEGGWDVKLGPRHEAIWLRPDRSRYDPALPVPRIDDS